MGRYYILNVEPILCFVVGRYYILNVKPILCFVAGQGGEVLHFGCRAHIMFYGGVGKGK